MATLIRERHGWRWDGCRDDQKLATTAMPLRARSPDYTRIERLQPAAQCERPQAARPPWRPDGLRDDRDSVAVV